KFCWTFSRHFKHCHICLANRSVFFLVVRILSGFRYVEILLAMAAINNFGSQPGLIPGYQLACFVGVRVVQNPHLYSTGTHAILRERSETDESTERCQVQ